ncbi:Uncharacterised protein [Chryseobacterium taklimakanense]|uniref:Uncharacterized protein n=1 Tax=Chryseobacterium taklimakanense TaxID=536441 RepID=A0A239WRR0_9FLAO|nr:Uncharacterised protein [Chryseobacterium taklimakanense]
MEKFFAGIFYKLSNISFTPHLAKPMFKSFFIHHLIIMS